MFVDTSAAVKLFHREAGSDAMRRLAEAGDSALLISRLGLVELLSAFAGKVRAGTLPEEGFAANRRRLRSILSAERGTLRVADVEPADFRSAQRLLVVHGVANGLRALDAVQLAVAERHWRSGLVDLVAAADRVMLEVASILGLPAWNPELPNVAP